MEKKFKINTPTVMVIFGITGDLSAKKIIPALWHLYEKKILPKRIRIVGYSRRNINQKQIETYILSVLKKHKHKRVSQGTIKKFVNLFSYQSGLFQNVEDYNLLSDNLFGIDKKWGQCTNKLFYLAVPPIYYHDIFNNLSKAKLTKPCSENDGWTRVIVEKPFGKDLSSAKKLDELLGKLFQPEQIYPIDHYLGKEIIENIITFRFANNLFENNWDNKLIEKIEVKVLEKFGVEDRGTFYDGVGALRDVGQNHLLQMLSMVTMKNPGDYSDKSIRERRAEVLSTLDVASVNSVKNNTYRAQYNGYKKTKGVSKTSKTETYFKIKTCLNSPKWEGVPIILEHGKHLEENRKEIIIYFRHPEPCYCPPGVHLRNKIVFNIDPEEKIKIHFWSMKPGFDKKIEERVFTFDLHYKNNKHDHIEEYEKLLFDCIVGDQTSFVSPKEVKAMWKFIDPIIKGWQKNLVGLKKYKKNTNQAIKNSKFIDQISPTTNRIKKEISLVGLGKMGAGLARQLLSKGWRVVGYNRSPKVTNELAKEGMIPAYSLSELTAKLSNNKLVWMMVPAGKPVEQTLFGQQGLMKLLKKGDTIIDGGNSNYKNTIKRSKRVIRRKINFLDVGVSGGPKGARYGASMMIGGKEKDFKKYEQLFKDLNVDNGYAFFPGHGAGHFVKMVHNGIEYGMMQSIAEGFDIMEKSKFKLDLHKVAKVYSYGTVIESRLITLMTKAFEDFGNNLKGVSGAAQESGEGAWTVETAHELNVTDKVLHEALRARKRSRQKPSFQGKLISALRFQFGGHDFKEGLKK